MLSVVMSSVIRPSVVMASDVAPLKLFWAFKKNFSHLVVIFRGACTIKPFTVTINSAVLYYCLTFIARHNYTRV
jgi:hypothetical protein